MQGREGGGFAKLLNMKFETIMDFVLPLIVKMLYQGKAKRENMYSPQVKSKKCKKSPTEISTSIYNELLYSQMYIKGYLISANMHCTHIHLSERAKMNLEIIFCMNFEARAENVAGDNDVIFLVIDSDSIQSYKCEFHQMEI